MHEGVYDFEELLQLPAGQATNVPEFLGPVEVTTVAGKGRGLVVTRDVSAGELLFANRAFAVAKPSQLLEATVRKLECPSRCSEEEFRSFFLLCSSSQGPVPELPQLTCRARDQPEGPQSQGSQASQGSQGPLRPVNRSLVKAILAANAHELDTSDVAGLQSAPSEVSSLFLTASLVNHSCRPSAARVFLGDMMFVRAARDLQRGEEITDGYISVLQPVMERSADIRKRYGFDLNEDRGLVEAALLPEAEVLAVLRRMDEAASLEDFQAILEDITTLVQRGMLRLVEPSEPSCSAKVQGAAQRLGMGLERVLLAGAGAVPVLAATAAILDADKADKEAARAYCRCCWIMEELAPHNAYHAKWALEALLCASRASLPLEDYVAYARKVLTYHIGPGTLETVLRRQLGKKRSGALLDSSHGELRMWPPGEVGITHQRRQVSNGDGEVLDLQLHLDEAAPPNEVEISANQMLLYVRVRQKRVYIALPGSVVHGAQGRPVRLSKQGRRIQASFHLQPASCR